MMESARVSQKSQKKYEEFLFTPAEYTILLQLSDLKICAAANEGEEDTKPEDGTVTNDDEIFFLISWSDYVFKIAQSKSDRSSISHISTTKEFQFYSTAFHMKLKIQGEPIFIKLVRGTKEDLGSTQILFSECFSKSLGCEEFHAQTISAQCKFVHDEKIKAIVDVSLKLVRDVSLCKEEKVADEGNESDDTGSDLSDFHCIGASDTLRLDESSNKVTDGFLMNLKKNVAGTSKCTDIFKNRKDATCECLPSSNLRSSFAVTCPRCGGNKSSKNSANSFSKLMERNSKEEDILNRLCLKHGVSLSDIRGEECKKKITKKMENRINRKNHCKKGKW